MVNKAAIGVVAVIVVVVLGGGLLMGTLLDDSGENNEGGTDGSTDEPNDGSTTTDEAPENSTNNMTAAQPASGDDARTPILSRRFDPGDVADNVTEGVNEYRVEQDREPLAQDEQVATTVAEMARAHSVAMADAGYTGHVIKGVDASERYRDYDLYDKCKYSDGKNVIAPGYRNHFEVVAVGTIGDYYEANTSAQFIDNESQAADLIVQDMVADADVSDRLTNQHFALIGTGVEITRENEVYVTVNFCS